MGLDTLRPETVMIDCKARTFVYRDKDNQLVTVSFQPPKKGKGTDLFLYCCSVAIAQSFAVQGGRPTSWTGAGHDFLDKVTQACNWELSSHTRDVYWTSLGKGRTAARVFVEFSVAGNWIPAQPQFFSRIPGYVIGAPIAVPGGGHCLWSIEFCNRTKEFEALFGIVQRILGDQQKQADSPEPSGASAHHNTERKDSVIRTGGFLPDMAAAFDEMKNLGVRRIRLLCYVGNFLQRTLPSWPREVLKGLDVRVLLRSPDVVWPHPLKGTAQYRKRVGQINTTLEEFRTHNAFKNMRHRVANSSTEPFCLFLPSEPFAHVALGEDRHNSRVMYFGLYTLQPRGDEGQEMLAYTGTGRPVIRVVEDSVESERLIDDFVNWFDFTWDLRAEESESSVLDRSPGSKEVLAIGFDGVVASGNGNSRAAKQVRNRNSSASLVEVPGAIKTLQRLSKRWQIVVITAGSRENAQGARKWLMNRGLLGSCIKCVLSQKRFRKLDVAARLGAVALVDEARHLNLDDHGAILRIPFRVRGMVAHKPGMFISAAQSWQQVERILTGRTSGAHDRAERS